jgi:hypothetical protein
MVPFVTQCYAPKQPGVVGVSPSVEKPHVLDPDVFDVRRPHQAHYDFGPSFFVRGPERGFLDVSALV